MHDLAQLFPDTPRWVETRSMLLGRRAALFGLRRDTQAHFAALDRTGPLVVVAGKPPLFAIERAVAAMPAGGVLLSPESQDIHLEGWRPEIAILHELAEDASADPPHRPGVTAQFINPRALDESIPLRAELIRAAEFSPVVAVCADGQAVSFCYGVPTETLWGVSVDTLEKHRGRGYAMLAFSHMAAHLAKFGKRPVWGSLESNHASLRLAKKLGFTAVDRVTVYAPVVAL